MTLYEIDQEILSLVNEDGEIADIECFESLNLAREQKIENVACWVKNLKAESAAIRDEEKNLAERRRANENKSDRLENFLAFALKGERYNSPRVNISYRRSEAVELEVADEVFMEHFTDYVKQTPSINKAMIKDALKAGITDIPAHLTERQNMQIK